MQGGDMVDNKMQLLAALGRVQALQLEQTLMALVNV